jgi:3-dehydroquinate synthetase
MIQLSTHLNESCPYFLVFNEDDIFCETLSNYSHDKLFFITEKNIYEQVGRDFYNYIHHNYNCELFFVSNAESSKQLEFIGDFGEKLIQKGLTKNSILLAFGGGAIGNLVGMLAALLFRGVRFIEIPTNIMGQTDSTLSNKQAVNGTYGKNLFGIYYAPIFIWSDIHFLKTESKLSRRSGIVEAVKNGFISNPCYLTFLDKKLNPEMKYNDNDLFELVHSIILSKLEIIKKDPTEKKYGIILEYGHTFGHAIEWLSKGKITHGESVSHGMILAAKLANKLGYINAKDVELHKHFINGKIGFNNPIPSYISTNDMLNTLTIDNKKTSSFLRFVLLESIGNVLNNEGDYLITVKSDYITEVLNENL